jgi:hypothetical protein
VAISIFVIYIQSIGSGIGIFSELFNNFLSVQYSAEEEIFDSPLLVSSLLPFKPAEENPSRHKLTKAEQSQFTLSYDLKQILVGLTLGDLFAEKKGVNTRLKFSQGTIHDEYLLHLYELFETYCSSAPKLYNSVAHKKTGKSYSSIRFLLAPTASRPFTHLKM